MLKDFFIECGYSDDEFNLIRNNYSLIKMSDDTLLARFKEVYDYFIEFGFNKQEIIKNTCFFPSICGLSLDNIKGKYYLLVSEEKDVALSFMSNSSNPIETSLSFTLSRNET